MEKPDSENEVAGRAMMIVKAHLQCLIVGDIVQDIDQVSLQKLIEAETDSDASTRYFQYLHKAVAEIKSYQELISQAEKQTQ